MSKPPLKIISFEEYSNNLTSMPLTVDGKPSPQEALERHHRIFSCLLPIGITGPTLDVACGSAIFYPSIRTYKPEMLPYAVTDMVRTEIFFGDEKVECHEFECEKTTIPLPDNSVGCIMFCDVIEHLLVDPIWVMLEFNRVLRPGGHVVISTPNACHIQRVLQILQGFNSATESHYKPTSIYQRHNREWTLMELNTLFHGCGFIPEVYSTQSHLLHEAEKEFLKMMIEMKLTPMSELDFGPEIFFLARKVKHKTLETTTNIDERWPEWLYTHYANYRRRPEVFPIVVGKDYA